MHTNKHQIIEDSKTFTVAFEKVKKAQKLYSTFSQQQVDKIFLAAATAANKMRIPLAKMAVEETGMGIAEDKVIKNHFALIVAIFCFLLNERQYTRVYLVAVRLKWVI